MDKRPKVSVVIPIHDMKGGAAFLWRSINALCDQTFQDFEIVITREGKMAENTNAGIKRARGKYIKILYLDDYLANPHALEGMVKYMDYKSEKWLICGVDNNPNPYWTDDLELGNNKLGSPSALMIRNDDPPLFDEKMSWLLDCDYYKRLEKKWGKPLILSGFDVTIGVHDGQMTRILTDEEKEAEEDYLLLKTYD